MLTYRNAQEILEANARSFGKEKIGLGQADGRTLAETILADRDYPPFNRSSMDGYAIRYGDFEKGIRHYSIVETIYAGDTATDPIGEGECYKIMTGAPVPAGADTVIRKEDVEETAGTIQIRLDACRPFQSIARQGEDLRAGDMVIGKARLCEPSVIGLLASLGKNELLAERLPRVALLTTGNEVVPVGAAVGPAEIRNSNRWLIQSLLKKYHIAPAFYEHVPDDRPVLQSVLGKLLDLPAGGPRLDGSSGPRPDGSSRPGPDLPFDIVILSGGVSAGDADYVPGVLEELGVRQLFYKLSIKPGKPVWCGIAGGNDERSPVAMSPGDPGPQDIAGKDGRGIGGNSARTMVFALPGNPFSCLVNFVLLIHPYLHACFGLPAPAPVTLPLRGLKKKHTPLDEFFPVRLGGTAGSPAGLTPIPINSSGDIRLGLDATALALHPAGSGDLPEGTPALYYDLF